MNDKSYHFNNLTPSESERLSILFEEMGESIQIIGKIFRHGYESTHPDYKNITNRGLLEKELGDVYYAIITMIESADINPESIRKQAEIKSKKIKQYLHHN